MTKEKWLDLPGGVGQMWLRGRRSRKERDVNANMDAMGGRNRITWSGARDECALGRTLREAHVLSADSSASTLSYAEVDRGWKGTIVAF